MGHDPRKRQLRSGYTLPVRDDFELLDQLEVLAEVLGVETRHVATNVGGLKLVRALYGASEKTTTQWRVRDDRNTKFARRLQEVCAGTALDVQRKWTVLNLYGSDTIDAS